MVTSDNREGCSLQVKTSFSSFFESEIIFRCFFRVQGCSVLVSGLGLLTPAIQSRGNRHETADYVEFKDIWSI